MRYERLTAQYRQGPPAQQGGEEDKKEETPGEGPWDGPWDFDGTKSVTGLGSGDSAYYPGIFAAPAESLRQLQNELTYFPRSELVLRLADGTTTNLRRDVVFHADHNSEDDTWALFRYNLVRPPAAVAWTVTTAAVRDVVAARFGQRCNTAIVNRYSGPSNFVWAHHDKTKDLAPESLIFSVSFGAPRVFVLEAAKDRRQSINLAPGSVFVLGPKTNREFKHSVPQQEGASTGENSNSERISITLRSVNRFAKQ